MLSFYERISFNALHTGVFKAFANSLDPDQCLTRNGIPEKVFFEEVDFEKLSADDNTNKKKKFQKAKSQNDFLCFKETS